MTAPPAAADERWDLTTVADDEVVFHRHGPQVTAEVVGGLEPGEVVERHGISVRTLERPAGELLCRFATVNDVHFGETECGKLGDAEDLVINTSPPGAPPYPEVMSRGAAAEIAALDPAVVVAKGDLTDAGRLEQYRAFLDCYATSFGDRLVHVRGNHDAMSGEVYAAEPHQEVALAGVTLAVLDTVIPGTDSGRLAPDQLEWLDELAARADRPVLVFGHHHVFQPGSDHRSDDYFGIRPDDSERLVDVFARRPALRGYFAGHTHRNRVRRFAETGEVPFVEVACVKDFPGSWAEYRVYESGVLQVHRRISTPDALAWSELNRTLFWGTYPEYAMGRLEDRCFPIST